MCNLYRMTRTIDEIAGLFGAMSSSGSNVGSEVYPGYPGLVIAEGRVESMTWGFPLALKGKSGQPLKPRPVNNTRTDKLGSGFWKPSFERRRCLIPVTAFAEAEGPKGRKVRTWLSVPDEPVFACAGIWRTSDEWGPVYSMVMTEACSDMDGIHDRMPVILKPDEHREWLTGSPDVALGLCRPLGVSWRSSAPGSAGCSARTEPDRGPLRSIRPLSGLCERPLGGLAATL